MRGLDKKASLLMVAMFFTTLSAFGQEERDIDYAAFMVAGESAYYAKDFDEAIRQFRAAKSLEDTEEVTEWLERVNRGYIHFLDSLSKENEKQARFAEAGRLSLLANTELENKRFQDALILSYEALNIIDTAATDEMNQAFGNAVGRVLLQKLAAFSGGVESLLSQRGSFLLQESGGIIHYIDKEGEGQPVTFRPHEMALRHVAFSAGGRFILTCSEDHTAKIWNTSGQLTADLTGHTEPVTYGVFSSDEKWAITCSRDNTVRIWNLEGTPVETLTAHDGNVYQAAISSDNARLITRSSDGSCRSWISEGWRQSINIKGEYFRDIQFSGDGRNILLLTVEGRLKIKPADAEDNRLLDLSQQAPITAIKVFQEFFFTFTQNGAIQQWTNDGQLLRAEPSHPAEVINLELSPDRRLLLSTAKDGQARLWNRNGAMLMSIELQPQHRLVPVYFSSDGRYIVGVQKDHLFKCPIPSVALRQLEQNPMPQEAVEAVREKFNIQRFGTKAE